MSDELYEIAFSGKIVEGADLEMVKKHLGRIFKADEKRLQQLFSGRRVLIKREADAATMARYRGAFDKVGAICEVRPLSAESPVSSSAPAESSKGPATQPETPAEPYQSRYPESDIMPQALVRTPLSVSGDQIEDLQADIAPVGSSMQHNYQEPVPPQFDLSGLDILPVGSDLSVGRPETPPPLPDTSGLTLAD